MAKLELPTVTLICADCNHVDNALAVVEKCKSLCNFGAVKFFTHADIAYPHRVEIFNMTSHIAYSVWMLKALYRYVDTPHLLVVQHDGWILNPDAWNPAWLEYSYIGPLFIQKHVVTEMSMGTGGFSFRSTALMEYVSKKVPDWDGTVAGADEVQKQLAYYEDGTIVLHHRDELAANGFKFAPVSEAVKFAQGGQTDPQYYVRRPFGFHGLWPNINRDTGVVEPFDLREE